MDCLQSLRVGLFFFLKFSFDLDEILSKRLLDFLSSFNSLLDLSLNQIPQDGGFFLNEFGKSGVIFLTISRVCFCHFDKSFLAFFYLIFYHFISTKVIETHLFFYGVDLDKIKSYQMFDIKAIVVKVVFYVLELGLDLFTGSLHGFDFFL